MTSHLQQCVVGSLQVDLKQIPNEWKRSWSRWLLHMLLGTEDRGRDQVDEQKDYQRAHQGDRLERLEKNI